METKPSKSQPRQVFCVTERDGRSFWTRVGEAVENRDGSLSIRLEALPVNGTLQVDAGQDGGGCSARFICVARRSTSTQDPNTGTADNTVECSREGEDLTCGFNARYIMDAAEALDDGQVDWRMAFPAPPKEKNGKPEPLACLLTDGTVQCVVMPVRI